jgi:hypothetical protein
MQNWSSELGREERFWGPGRSKRPMKVAKSSLVEAHGIVSGVGVGCTGCAVLAEVAVGGLVELVGIAFAIRSAGDAIALEVVVEGFDEG